MKGKGLRDLLQKAEMLVNENKRLGERAEVIMKKMRENNEEARALVVSETRKLKVQSNKQLLQERGNQEEEDVEVDEVLGGQQNLNNGAEIPSLDVELPRGREKGPKKSVAQLKFEEKILMKRIGKSASNLKDHHDVLDALEKEFGRSNSKWVEKLKEIKVYSKIHKNFVEASEQRLGTIRVELRHKTRVARDQFQLHQGSSSSRVLAKPRSNQGASSSSVLAKTKSNQGASSSSVLAKTRSKKSLNESVLDCGIILKKIAVKEIQAMTPLKLKEEDSPGAPHVCNFENCSRSFTCASPFVAHLEKHRIQNLIKINCPFANCDYSNKREELTTHIRAKHTKELLFQCDHCPTQFHSMAAKAAHEKKHSLPGVWAQCTKHSCLRFYQVANRRCRACGKK